MLDMIHHKFIGMIYTLLIGCVYFIITAIFFLLFELVSPNSNIVSIRSLSYFVDFVIGGFQAKIATDTYFSIEYKFWQSFAMSFSEFFNMIKFQFDKKSKSKNRIPDEVTKKVIVEQVRKNFD
jgi:hypothetical protein